MANRASGVHHAAVPGPSPTMLKRPWGLPTSRPRKGASARATAQVARRDFVFATTSCLSYAVATHFLEYKLGRVRQSRRLRFQCLCIEETRRNPQMIGNCVNRDLVRFQIQRKQPGDRALGESMGIENTTNQVLQLGGIDAPFAADANGQA